MNWWHRLIRRNTLETQLDAELQEHLDRHTADLIGSGMPEHEARRQARLDLGGVEGIKEQCRDARGTRWLEDAVTDLMYAARVLRHTPGFAAVAVLSLALGLAANIAVASLLYAVVLKTVPVRDPGDLVLLGERAPDRQTFSWSRTQFRDLGSSATLSGLCAFRPQMELGVGGPSGTDAVKAQFFSGNCFDLIGVRAVLGRTFTPEDDRAGEAQPVAVISYAFWQRYFGGDPSVIGRTLRLKDRPFIVVGITPREFLGLELGQPLDITIPLAHAPLVLSANLTASQSVRWLRLIGRLAPGVSRERAAADLEQIWRQGRQRAPGAAATESRLEVLTGAQGLNDLRRQFSTPLRLLAAGVGLLLIVACANLAGLMLARARARDHEIRLRAALGAGPGRLVRQLLAEACLLAALAGAAGFGLAIWGSRTIVALLSRGRSPLVLPPVVDARLLLFACALTAATSLIFGVWPALAAARRGSLASSTLRTATRAGRMRTGALVAAQTALAAILLTGAVLFARSLAKLHAVDLGFDPRNTVLARLQPGLAGERIQPRIVYRDLFVRLSDARGVRSASMVMDLPLGGVSYTAGVSVPPAKAADDLSGFNFVGPRFCETMGIPILSGRDFTLQDDERAPPVAIVSASLAARHFPGGGAVGEHLDANGTIVDVAGVAADVPYQLRAAKEFMVYRPFLQTAGGAAGLTFVVRSDLPPAAAADLVRSIVRDAAPTVPLSSLSTLDARVDASIPSERLLANISSFFGVMAVLLVGIGIYGTLAYSLAQRTREFGVRLALGATTGDIARTVLAGALAPVCAGLLIGAPLAFAVARIARDLLFGITPRDPIAYTAALAVLLTAALTAAALPTRRAIRADALAALRED